ncbi:MAG: DUF308 domain-containing protein [Ruminococcus sp.]|nr:DUF308 domain-containing protein [Ruminococcus sp.]
MKTVKKIFGNYLLLSAVCILLGAALIANPDFFTHAISYTIGGLSIAAGAIEIVRFVLLKQSTEEDAPSPTFPLFRGIILVAIGIFLILKPDFIAQVLSFAFGLYMVISGGITLLDSLKVRKSGDGWQTPCLLASLTLIGGILILCDPLMPERIMFRVLGIVLLITGITNMIGCVIGKRAVGNLLAETDTDKKDKKKRDFIDI